jgi:signal transduction histidine kinase
VRRLRLRTQLAIAALFLGAYTSAIGLTYVVERRAQDRLDRAFEQDLAALARLPRLSDLLRHEALLSQQYLLTGRAEWLVERSRALVEIRRIQVELEPLVPDPRERELWGTLNVQLGSYIAEQEQWIERRRSGRLGAGAAMEVLSRRDAIDALLHVLLTLRDRNAATLRAERDASRRASDMTFVLTLVTGLAVGGMLVVFISGYVITPLTRLQRYAGSWTLGSDWSLPQPQAGPEIDGLFVSLRDLSQRLNEEYAKERDLGRFKGQLVSMVSHEVNNALSIISGAATILEETQGEAFEKRQEYFDMLKANIQALGTASQNLLNMGRLDSGRFAISPRKVALGDVIRPCVQRLELLSLRKSQRISLELPGKPAYVRADPDSLSLVLTNLIGNAIKYTPEGGAIKVVVDADPEDPRRVRLAVVDTGIGIKEDDRERIFSGFYRTEKGKRAAAGFGVGLSLARRILEAHDAALRVDSEPGKGSTFWFTLPLWSEAPQPQEVA